jgi:predicted ester cyclase
MSAALDAVMVLIGPVWSEGDSNAARPVLGPTYTIHRDPGDPWEGQTLDADAYVARVEALRRGFPDQRFTIFHTAIERDTVALAWNWVGSHLGDLPGFPATGRAIRMTGSTFYFTHAGKVTGHWQITDRLGVFQQLQAPA